MYSTKRLKFNKKLRKNSGVLSHVIYGEIRKDYRPPLPLENEGATSLFLNGLIRPNSLEIFP